VGFGARSVLQQPVQHLPFLVGKGFADVDDVCEFRRDVAHAGVLRLDFLQAFGETGRGEGRGAGKEEYAHGESSVKSCA